MCESDQCPHCGGDLDRNNSACQDCGIKLDTTIDFLSPEWKSDGSNIDWDEKRNYTEELRSDFDMSDTKLSVATLEIDYIVDTFNLHSELGAISNIFYRNVIDKDLNISTPTGVLICSCIMLSVRTREIKGIDVDLDDMIDELDYLDDKSEIKRVVNKLDDAFLE